MFIQVRIAGLLRCEADRMYPSFQSPVYQLRVILLLFFALIDRFRTISHKPRTVPELGTKNYSKHRGFCNHQAITVHKTSFALEITLSRFIQMMKITSRILLTLVTCWAQSFKMDQNISKKINMPTCPPSRPASCQDLRKETKVMKKLNLSQTEHDSCCTVSHMQWRW